MQGLDDAGDGRLEILPLVVVVQAFPARPSSIPDIRDFVRRRLTRTQLAEDEIRTFGERVSEVLLDAAGSTGTIQVSLRIFPEFAEVDVTRADPGDDLGIAGPIGEVGIGRAIGEVGIAGAIGASAPNGSNRPEHAHSAINGPSAFGGVSGGAVLSVDPSTVPGAADGPLGDPPGGRFADWLAAALRREGMTMEAAARRLRVSSKTISRWVSGTTEPRLRDLARIREIFGELPFP